MIVKYQIDKTNRSYWIKSINSIHQQVMHISNIDEVHIILHDNIYPDDFEPWHIVSLACTLDLVHKIAHKMQLFANQKTIEFLDKDLHLQMYFYEQSHINAKSRNILNLWQIKSDETLFYSNELSRYLKQEYFSGRDISMLKIMLDELYANVADHSKAEGIAYSYINYNEKKRIISVAFCDFGIGIPTSLKQANLHPENSRFYIEHATKCGVSARTNIHNAGFGLATVLDCMQGSNHYLRIISNNEMFYHLNNNNEIVEKTFPLNFNFAGTLIYYNIDISQFENEEVIGTGDLFSDNDW
ncbi:MAG: hypothetical protein IJ328_08100 [Muribaculaceae bacterium]|nr:hypothetical protein [Muribaculaceae bacterium]